MKLKITLFMLIVTLLFSACRGKSNSSQEAIEIHPELKNIPVYPKATAWGEGIPSVNQSLYKYPTYSYTVKTIQYENIMEFYEEEMPASGWELLSKGDDSKSKSADLMFTKSKIVVHIQIFPRMTGVYIVTVVFYDDPVLEEQ